MLETLASGAIEVLLIFFWATLAFIVIGGALWARSSKRSK